MRKFEVKKSTMEIKFKDRFDIKEGCTLNDTDSVGIKSFDSKEEALEELKKYETSIQQLSGSAYKYFLVEEYYIEQNEYDEDGEWLENRGVWEFSPIEIRVVNDCYDTVKTFNNYKEAEKYCSDSEEQLSIMF